MGMFNASGAANAQVRQGAGQFLRAGIHNVKFTGVEKYGSDMYAAIEFSFEGEDGAVHNARLFEPRSNERQANRFDSSREDPSEAEQFMCKVMHIISALNPDVYAKIQSGAAKFDPADFDTLIALVKKILTPCIGVETQIKLVPGKSGFAGFPGFPARIDKNGDLYLSTSFVGKDLTLSAYEKQLIDAAANAKPTDMAKRDTSEIDDLVSNDSSVDPLDDSDLPF